MYTLIYASAVGVSFIIAGIMAKKKSPTKISERTGYRTKRSKSSQEAWTFANNLASKMYIVGGIVGLIVSNFLRIYGTTNVYQLIIPSLILGLIFQILTEVILRMKFDEKGRRKK
ncbi:MAG: SdpI family protein [Sarcina sp.]